MFTRERSAVLGAVVGVCLMLGVVPGSLAVVRAQGASMHDAQIRADIHKALDKKQYANVSALVRDSNVTLSGTVALYGEKEDLDQKVQHVNHVKGIDNEIRVAGASVDDATLRAQLARKLAYDRVGYGTTAFNSLTVGVKNGVVTLGGMVYGPADKSSAVGLVEYTPGVKDVIDNLQVAPLSPMDDRLRIALARRIYSAPQLQKYAYDPQMPIRITVVNGNVTLTGMVNNKADRDVAGLRAKTVSGVFKVTNDLQVAAQKSGK